MVDRRGLDKVRRSVGRREVTWLVLAFLFGCGAAVDIYLAITMAEVWPVVLGAIALLAMAGCARAALTARKSAGVRTRS